MSFEFELAAAPHRHGVAHAAPATIYGVGGVARLRVPLKVLSAKQKTCASMVKKCKTGRALRDSNYVGDVT